MLLYCSLGNMIWIFEFETGPRQAVFSACCTLDAYTLTENSHMISHMKPEFHI